MPNCKSAEKRLRQNEKRRIRNKTRNTELKTLTKRLLRAVHDQQQDDAQQLYSRLTKRLDQATAQGFLHRNTTSRRKSRLAHQMKELTGSSS